MTPIRPLVALALPLVLSIAGPSEAQWRPGYPIPYYPPYPAYRWAEPEADVRLKVKPREAAVYIDGYYAGVVDDFDGAFGRLHVAPGRHEIVIYLEGHRSLVERLYLSPRTTRTIEGVLNPLAPGEAPSPRPLPAVDPDDADRGDDPRPLPPGTPRRPSGPPPVPRADNPDRPDRPDRPAPPDRPGRADGPDRARPLGTLSIRVQPAGATIVIDGESWTGPGQNERLIVQVPEGRHTVEVRRDGFAPFVTTVDVRRGQTAPVNISLTRDQ